MESGYVVSLVCPRHIDNRRLLLPGVELEEVGVASIRCRNFIKRAWRESRESFRLLLRARSIRADCWLLTIPSMFLAFLAPSVLWRRSCVLDVRDLSWEYLSDASLLQRVSKLLLRFAFRCSLGFFRAVSVTNPAELDYVARYWRGSTAPFLVSNGVDRERFDALAGLGLPAGELTVTYVGNVGLAQRLDTLVEAAERLPDVRFVIVGAGVDFERIVKLVADRKLANVRLTGRVLWESVHHFYKATHILYAQLARDYSGAVPSKLYEYLATGKYLIYGGQGEAVRALQDFEHHRLIPPCDVDALVDAIEAYRTGQEKHCLSRLNRERVERRHIRQEAVVPLINAVTGL